MVRLGTALALAALLAGCGDDVDALPTSPAADAGSVDATVTDAAPAVPALTALAIDTGTLIPAFDPKVVDYEVTSLNAVRPIKVTATPAAGVTVTINGGTSDTITLAPKQDVVVVARVPSGAEKTYTIHYLPADFPAYAVTPATGAGSENLLLTPDNKFALLVDRAGAPLYWRSAKPAGIADFDRHDAGGKTYYSFGTIEPNITYFRGSRVLMDASFRDIGSLQLLANAGHGVLLAGAGDFLVLGEEHWVLQTFQPQGSLVGAIVQEVDHGQVTFEWSSFDHPSLVTDSVDGAADYVHMNAIDVDPSDGNFIISLRHTDSVLKVNRTTGATMWTLGGKSDDFGLTSDQRFSHQHHARFQKDGSLTMLDNGNNLHRTRAIRFVLDQTAKKVTSFQVIDERPAGAPVSAFMGSVSWPDTNRWLIGWGGWDDIPATAPPSVDELVGGTRGWSLTFTSPKVFSFRALLDRPR